MNGPEKWTQPQKVEAAADSDEGGDQCIVATRSGLSDCRFEYDFTDKRFAEITSS
jgi:hypothetical protein